MDLLTLLILIILVILGICIYNAYKNRMADAKQSQQAGGQPCTARQSSSNVQSNYPRQQNSVQQQQINIAPCGDNDGKITLQTANGQDVVFDEIACIIYRGKRYEILQPEELLEGMNDDEALVFEMTTDENGNPNFVIELDDEIIDAVFAEYDRLYDQSQ